MFCCVSPKWMVLYPLHRFFVEVSRSRDQRLVTINCNSKNSSEVWFIDSRAPFSCPTLIQSRQPGLMYHVEHSDDHLFILANTGKGQEYQVIPHQSLWQHLYDSSFILYVTFQLNSNFYPIVSFCLSQATQGTFGFSIHATLGANVHTCSRNSH